MTTDRPQLLFQEIDPPAGLFSAVIVRIAQARRRAARLQFAAFGTLGFVSAVMLIPAFQYAAAEFSTSGFYEYASLFFDSISRGYWQEILYSLNSSLPSFALLLLIAVIATGIWSLSRALRSVRTAFTRAAFSA